MFLDVVEKSITRIYNHIKPHQACNANRVREIIESSREKGQ